MAGWRMTEQSKTFGDVARGLARNPLGIIALFIVLVYGLASLVTVSAASFTAAERLPLIYFLVIFPVLVLGVFAWLVSKHSGQLFAPADFKDEENYMRMQLTAVASLVKAGDKRESGDPDINDIVQTVRGTVSVKAHST